MNTRNPMIVRPAAVMGLTLIAATASAQWSVISLHPELPDASHSTIRGASGIEQAGAVTFNFFESRAAIWTGTADSYVDLHPEGAIASFAVANGDGQQGGYLVGVGQLIPGVWSGTAASFVNLMPDVGPGPAQSGLVHAVAGGKQGGYVRPFPDSLVVASLWSGTAESWVNMNPAGATSSVIFGMGGNQQVGSADFEGAPDRAALWTGTTDSFVNLHPGNFPGIINSFLVGTDGEQQVGNIRVGNAGGLRAAVWSGTADSVVDLHPGIGDRSFARAVSEGYQVGFIEIDDPEIENGGNVATHRRTAPRHRQSAGITAQHERRFTAPRPYGPAAARSAVHAGQQPPNRLRLLRVRQRQPGDHGERFGEVRRQW